MRDGFYAFAKWIIICAVAVVALWHRFPLAIQTLLTLMALDITSGILASIRMKTVNSNIMLRGLVTKLAVFPLLALLHVVEQPLSLPFDLELIGAMGFIVYESMSIIENCANAGVPIPFVIVSALAKAKIKTATPAEIRSEFRKADETTISVKNLTEFIKTPDSQPDLRVEHKTTTIEESHVKPDIKQG